MMDANVELIKSVLTFAGGIIIAGIPLWYKGRIDARKQAADPWTPVISGYEKLIRQQRVDLDLKIDQVRSLEGLLERNRRQNEEMQLIIEQLKDELNESKDKNQNLERQIELIKSNYSSGASS
jgi:chromosome segregation ATPase